MEEKERKVGEIEMWMKKMQQLMALMVAVVVGDGEKVKVVEIGEVVGKKEKREGVQVLRNRNRRNRIETMIHKSSHFES